MIKNRTEYTIKKYRDFYFMNTFKLNVILLASLLAFSAFFLIIYFVLADHPIFFLIIGLIIALGGIIYYTIRFITYGKNIKSVITREYDFLDEVFVVTSKNKGNISKTEYTYQKIIKYKKDRKNTYIFITKGSAFIIGNEGYVKGNQTELLDLLRKKTGN